MTNSCFERLEDLSEIFGRNYYRLIRLNYENIRDDLTGLEVPNFVLAQLWGEDVYNSKVLACLGFQKTSLLALLVAELSENSPGQSPRPETGIDLGMDLPGRCPQPSSGLNQDGALLDRHAVNLRLNGLAFDPRIAEETIVAFNRWRLEQSLGESGMLHFVDGDGLVSFKPEADKVTIDLLSVLTPRKGVGTDLAHRVFGWAQARGSSRVEVSTECENLPAFLFYQKCGFRLTRTIGVFHRHAGG